MDIIQNNLYKFNMLKTYPYYIRTLRIFKRLIKFKCTLKIFSLKITDKRQKHASFTKKKEAFSSNPQHNPTHTHFTQ